MFIFAAEKGLLRKEYCGVGDVLGVVFGDHVAAAEIPEAGELLREGEEKMEVGEPMCGGEPTYVVETVLVLKEEDCRRRKVKGEGRGKERVGRR